MGFLALCPPQGTQILAFLGGPGGPGGVPGGPGGPGGSGGSKIGFFITFLSLFYGPAGQTA